MITENLESTGEDKGAGLSLAALARRRLLLDSGQGREAAVGETSENTRRRLVKGALAAAPIVLALRGQSALAATGCASPSAILSGNLSPGRTAQVCATGLSPGYWKVCQHLYRWSSAGMTPPTFSETCVSGMPSKTSKRLTEGTLFGQIPPFASSGSLAGYGAWRILAYPSQVDKGLEAFNINQIQLARHLIASYLNLKTVPNFPLTEAQLKAMWEQGSVDAYCPNGSGCTSAQLWSAQTVVCYLRNYTMDSASVSTDPIPWVCTSI